MSILTTTTTTRVCENCNHSGQDVRKWNHTRLCSLCRSVFKSRDLRRRIRTGYRRVLVTSGNSAAVSEAFARRQDGPVFPP
jgi:hypothetical protein